MVEGWCPLNLVLVNVQGQVSVWFGAVWFDCRWLLKEMVWMDIGVIFTDVNNLNISMQNQSTRNLEQQQLRIKFKRSSTRIQVDQLHSIENQDCFLSKILCIHHVKTAFRYLCDLNNTNIVRYNSEYEQFLEGNKLRDVLGEKRRENVEANILWQAFKLQKWAILVILMLSLAAGAASVVIIYYQQTLAKYIITLTSTEQYKWFSIIVATIIARFFVFNYLTALTNNVAINVKVGLENLFMRVIFFLDHDEEELNMHRMKYLGIESLIQAINFFPYSLVALSTIIGVLVLVFVLNDRYGFVFFGIFLLFLFLHIMILVFVYRRLRRNELIKDQIAQQSKWVFRSLLPLIFDRITDKIVNKIMQAKNQSLLHDRFYNFTYTLTQFLSDTVPIISIIVYYGINHEGNKDMNIKNTYLTAAYLGMLYYPFKIYVYGSFAIVKGFEQYFSMQDNFRQHLNTQKVNDIHLPSTRKVKRHCYPDDIGQCFHYQYAQSNQGQSGSENLPSVQGLNRRTSNVFIQLNAKPGQSIMVYFTTGKQKQVERYIKELISGLQISKSVAVIHEDPLVLPEPFQLNITFYSQYNQQRFHNILRLVELDYFIPQIEALGSNPLNYRVSKYYEWHQCRLELARALYNNVDYLIISKYIVIEDTKLLSAVLDYRKREGKITIIANNWHLDIFRLADRNIFFHQEQVESGTYEQLSTKEDSILNNIKRQLKREGGKIDRSEQVAILHQNFLALVKKKAEPIELQRKVYFEFFGYAHCGGAMVVLLALAAPIGFKIYLSSLIGKSTLPKAVIYPDILIFGVLYLFFVFLRGLVLSAYFRISSSHLFHNIIDKHRHLCGDQIISVYKQKDDRIEHDFKKVDSSLVISFQLGFSVMIESYGSLVIVGLGQPIVLAMAVPLIVLLGIVNVLYNKIERKLLALREKYEEQLKIFVNYCTTRALILFKYGKFGQIQGRFKQMHRLHITFSCNQMWVLSGMRIMGEIIIIIAVIIFLVIMIETQSNKITNLPMVAYGVSLFLNMSFSYRFNLKTFSIIEAQMLSITKCISFFKQIDQQSQTNSKGACVNISEAKTIQFRDISIQFGAKSCSNINLKFQKGDRVAVSTDSKSLVTLPFYLLKKQVFSKQHISGSIFVNGEEHESFNLQGLCYIHHKPLLPSKGTIFDLCKSWREELTSIECSQILSQFFKEAHLDQLFTIQSQLTTINIAYQQILSVFRVVKFQHCRILILVSAFDYLDILTRIKIQKYLMGLKTIDILINITNNPEITHLYKRHISFKREKFAEDKAQAQNANE